MCYTDSNSISVNNTKGYRMKAWTITQLKRAMIEDLKLCQNTFERINCSAVCKKEIRDLAESLTRKLTPCEVAILESL